MTFSPEAKRVLAEKVNQVRAIAAAEAAKNGDDVILPRRIEESWRIVGKRTEAL